MRTAQLGDRVVVHYQIRLQDGSQVSSHGREPLEVTVGIAHPRLPGLGLALVGLAPGEAATLTVPPEDAYGLSDPARVRRWSRLRFPNDEPLKVGQQVQYAGPRGRRRLVRIVKVTARTVVVDTNHRWAGQKLELEVAVVAIRERTPPVPRPGGNGPSAAMTAPRDLRLFSSQARAVAFDVDADSLAVLREALPDWTIEVVNGATAASLAPDWDPALADFLIVGLRADQADTVGLCRFLAFHTSSTDDREEAEALLRRPGQRADAPLLVLVPPGQEALVEAVLEAGADRCFNLPIHPKAVASLLAHRRAVNLPDRHTLNLEQARGEDRWRDDGGKS